MPDKARSLRSTFSTTANKGSVLIRDEISIRANPRDETTFSKNLVIQSPRFAGRGVEELEELQVNQELEESGFEY